MRNYRRYSKDQIKNAVKNSKSWREVINILAPDNKGYKGSESHLKKKSVEYQIDFSHFRGKAWNKGLSLMPRRPITDYLMSGMFIKSNDLKRRLIKENLKEAKCECCLNIIWLDYPIHLELHHKDSNNSNNAIENLEILCSNCHSYRHKKFGHISKCRQTNTNATIKIRKKILKTKIGRVHLRKVVRPDKELLLKLVAENPMTTIAKNYGVTDNAVRKWCKSYDIQLPNRVGYWTKQKFNLGP